MGRKGDRSSVSPRKLRGQQLSHGEPGSATRASPRLIFVPLGGTYRRRSTDAGAYVAHAQPELEACLLLALNWDAATRGPGRAGVTPRPAPRPFLSRPARRRTRSCWRRGDAIAYAPLVLRGPVAGPRLRPCCWLRPSQWAVASPGPGCATTWGRFFAPFAKGFSRGSSRANIRRVRIRSMHGMRSCSARARSTDPSMHFQGPEVAKHALSCLYTAACVTHKIHVVQYYGPTAPGSTSRRLNASHTRREARPGRQY